MKKKLIFIDRDGTIIKEPEDEQIDSLVKLEFEKKVISSLYKIQSVFNYSLIMVSNQDGLGTKDYPQESFDIVQSKMLTTLLNEDVKFDDILIDITFEHENAPTRKPKTGMVEKYMNNLYDIQNSYVIGDRLTDVELAKNIGCKCILYNYIPKKNDTEAKIKELDKYCILKTDNWDEIVKLLSGKYRSVTHNRTTKETNIKIELNPNGQGLANIDTGLNFFNHLLEQFARHSGCDISILCKGDLHIDEHHTMEDIAITLGEAFDIMLQEKRGLERYGFSLPMDDVLATVALDLSGRSWLVWDVDFRREKIGDVPTEMLFHFFKSFSDNCKCNLNIKAEGTNEHHKSEAIFKAMGRTFKQALKINYEDLSLPTTKGKL
ncbi:MAG: bifunctional imidazole glycerol-phosphate dehydratase/histidinol phosphatase [Bacteroidetes bacterium GWE2_29_8]|nr:MAG: bifunctional imidazole glycerol-phosphate dehydratase/histidinol phosphatase [Bacteroidetes bacterium GWE2_29_8]